MTVERRLEETASKPNLHCSSRRPATTPPTTTRASLGSSSPQKASKEPVRTRNTVQQQPSSALAAAYGGTEPFLYSKFFGPYQASTYYALSNNLHWYWQQSRAPLPTMVGCLSQSPPSETYLNSGFNGSDTYRLAFNVPPASRGFASHSGSMRLNVASARRQSEPAYGHSTNDVKRLRAFFEQRPSLRFQLGIAELQWAVIRQRYAASYSLYIAKVDPFCTLSDPVDASSDIQACREIEIRYRNLLETKAAKIRCIQLKLRADKARALDQKVHLGPEASIHLSTEPNTPDLQTSFALNIEPDEMDTFRTDSDPQATLSSSDLDSLVERFRHMTAILDDLDERLLKLSAAYAEAFARRRLFKPQESDTDTSDAQFEGEYKQKKEIIVGEMVKAVEDAEQLRQRCALIDPDFDPEFSIDMRLGSAVALSTKSRDKLKEPSVESGVASVQGVPARELHRLALLRLPARVPTTRSTGATKPNTGFRAG